VPAPANWGALHWGQRILSTSAPVTASADTRYWDVDHAAYGPVTRQPMSRFAQVAAANLGAANALIPQVTHHDRADLTAIDALRQRFKGDAEARGLKLTTLVFQIAALAAACGISRASTRPCRQMEQR
jgi:pyruvate/2-oxoglutarate dehydrogenase complex dihydrolipoamide acyltransferase (E2) component